MKVKASAGVGFWDLSRYPWGGDFKRFGHDVTLEVERVARSFSDGSPRQVVAIFEGRKVGIEKCVGVEFEGGAS